VEVSGFRSVVEKFEGGIQWAREAIDAHRERVLDRGGGLRKLQMRLSCNVKLHVRTPPRKKFIWDADCNASGFNIVRSHGLRTRAKSLYENGDNQVKAFGQASLFVRDIDMHSASRDKIQFRHRTFTLANLYPLDCKYRV